MKTIARAMLVVALLGLSACMLPDAAEKASARQKIKDGALVLDVRDPKDYKAGHYAGATNIPYRQVEARCNELGDKDHPIVVYCVTGMAAGKSKEILQAAGFKDVTNAGGLSELRNSP